MKGLIIILGILLTWLSMKRIEYVQETKDKSIEGFLQWVKAKYWDKRKDQ